MIFCGAAIASPNWGLTSNWAFMQMRIVLASYSLPAVDTQAFRNSAREAIALNSALNYDFWRELFELKKIFFPQWIKSLASLVQIYIHGKLLSFSFIRFIEPLRTECVFSLEMIMDVSLNLIALDENLDLWSLLPTQENELSTDASSIIFCRAWWSSFVTILILTCRDRWTDRRPSWAYGGMALTLMDNPLEQDAARSY
jgi:hypothetical protein